MGSECKAGILLVDDYPANLLALEAILDSPDKELVKARSGKEALEWLLKRDFSLILLDVQMPEMDGFETAALIRQRERTARIPIIFITAINKNEEHILKGYAVGACDYICKPFAPEVLKAKVEALIRLCRQNSEEVVARADADSARQKEAEARAQAESANVIKDQFLATVSHELRTPLTAMLGWARLLRSGKLDSATTANAVAAIERNAKAQAQIVEELLDISHIVSGKMRLQVELINLAHLVERVVNSLRLAASSKMIDLQVEIDHQAGLVAGDAERLQQVMWNLISNAVKFTGEGGHVEVLLARDRDQVRITVSDTGVGIPTDFLPYVFDRFRQADTSLTRTHSGLGLGLSIARSLIEMHGGSIEAYSAGQHRGASFIICLPVAAECHPRPAKKPAVRCFNDALLDGIKIMLVEDEADTRDLIALILKEQGAHVKAAASVDEALSSFYEYGPDLLISDISMPGQDGYDLIKKVRAGESAAKNKLPAVALTAYASVEDRIRALAAGYQQHVPKPVEPEELITAVASLACWVKG